jgi:PKD repeat protein
MRRILLYTMSLVILVSSLFVYQEVEASEREGTASLLLNTRQIFENGRMFLSQAPHTVQDGVTYISLRTLGEYMGHTVYYVSSTRDYGIKNGITDIKFKVNSNVYTVNGQTKTQLGKPYLLDGNLMVPLRTFAQTQNYQLVPKMSQNIVEILYSKNSNSIGNPSTPAPAPIPTPSIEAIFTTNKTSYMIGETVSYHDYSKNGGTSITSRKWQNREDVFFIPGPKTITLTVTNRNGQSSTVSKQIFIEDEVMFTRGQYNLIHTPVGEKLMIDGMEVLNYDMIDYNINEEKLTLLRSNSPERITREGIYYEDTLSGEVRVDVHKINGKKDPMQLFLVAHNPSNQTITVQVKNTAYHTPTKYVLASGKHTVGRYLQTFLTPMKSISIQIPPNQTRELYPLLSQNILKPDDTITLYVETYSSMPVKYQVIALEEEHSFDRVYPFLRGVNADRDGIHIRGTFEYGNRSINVQELIGTKRERILFGDREHDQYAQGVDSLSGIEEVNTGNYGVFYNVNFQQVEANTAVILNARGGEYAGAFIVNGRVVYVPTNGALDNRHEAVVLYRTGNRKEKLNIQFIPAAGSNLPINVLFMPMYE